MIRTAALNKTLRSRHWLPKLLALLLLLALAVATGAAIAADDDPPGRVGRVIESQGQSWLYDTDADEWIDLQRNRPITSGNRIAVDGSARLELRIGSTTIRLAGGSEIEMRRLDDERIELFLVDGSAALRVRSHDVSREIEVNTPIGRFTPRRIGHYRIDHRDDSSAATAWNGELHFENDDSALDVTSGRSAEFWREGSATHYAWSEPQSDEFGDWVARANREDDRSGAVTRYVSPEMTGYEDLDRYGQWESHPEYGPLWMPTTVVSGWAPYRYGHWTWISPWGWTWVDDARWGFAPFHYGRWVVVGGRWCWAPGRYVARPVYAPALVAWTGSVHVGIGAPIVGWVPLAPREPYYPYYGHRGGYWKSVNSGHLHLFPHRTPRTIPTRAIRYANQAAPGGLSAVPSSALQSRRSIAPALSQIDPEIRHNLSSQPWRSQVPPGAARTATTVPRRADGGGHAATASPAQRPGLPPGMRPGVRPPQSVARQPEAATVAREREQIPRPVRPTQNTQPRQVSPQVRADARPEMQTPVRPAPQAPDEVVRTRRGDPGRPGRPDLPGRAAPPAAPPARVAPPHPAMREPPRAQVQPAPAPRAAMPPQPAPRDMQRPTVPDTRMRAPEARVRAPEARVQAPESRARMPEQRGGGQRREQTR
jgi:hypothetical protein